MVWESAEGKLSVLVQRSVLEHLKEVAEQVFSVSGVEAGGVLIGRSEDLIETGRRIITVENFESDMSCLHDQSVVGFVQFRRQTMLHLQESDFLSLRAGVGLVCLVIRPDDKTGAVGGFFFRDGKTVRCPPVEMQFPIDGNITGCKKSASDESRKQEAGDSSLQKVLYGVMGAALMLASFAVWLVGR